MFYPSWYPDGKQLAVMDAHDEVIKRIDLESGAVKTMTDRARVLAGMPSVSTDGKWIAFAGQANTGQAYEQTKNVIWLVSDTGVLHTLETPPLQGRAPSWSPDQQRLAFESNRGSPNQSYAIFIINRDGSGLMRVTDYAMNANHPMWSPDGRQLVFSARHANAPSLAIAIIDSPPAAALPPAK
jgi:Tol biopolymer transport system component